MIKILNESVETVKFDNNKSFESLWTTTALDRSEYFSVSDNGVILVFYC